MIYARGIQLDERHDPWSEAREAARDEVVAALAPRERRCPACGAPQRGAGRVCARCGADLTARVAHAGTRRAWLFAGLVALALALAAIAVPVVAARHSCAARRR